MPGIETLITDDCITNTTSNTKNYTQITTLHPPHFERDSKSTDDHYIRQYIHLLNEKRHVVCEYWMIGRSLDWIYRILLTGRGDKRTDGVSTRSISFIINK